MRGFPRGKMRPWDGCLISSRVNLGRVGGTGSIFVICKRSVMPEEATAGDCQPV
jgi:hypothetical protein